MKGLSLGTRVKTRREAMGLTQQKLAETAKVSRPYLSLIERGEATNLSMQVLGRIALALGTTPSELTGESEQADVLISLPLRKFALEESLPLEDVFRLARIELRGRRPETVEDWRKLYKAIQKAMPPER
jgi:transcriptional regulator with XRE-family HTH domain